MRLTSELFDLPASEYSVSNFRIIDNDGIGEQSSDAHTASRRFYMIDVRYLEARRPICPKCKKRMAKHGSHWQACRHISLNSIWCFANIFIQRWRCSCCGHTHTQIPPIIWDGCIHLTVVAKRRIEALLTNGASMQTVSNELGATTSSIRTTKHALVQRRSNNPPPEVLSLDDFALTHNLYAIMCKRMDKGATIFYDGLHGTYHSMSTASKEDAVAAFAQHYTKGELMRIKAITCDMDKAYIIALRKWFPDVPICIDKYHVTKLMQKAVVDARNRCFPPKDPRTKKLKLGRKYLLIRNPYDRKKPLTKRDVKEINRIIHLDGADDLRVAYLALLSFFEWCDTEFESIEQRKIVLHQIIKRCVNSTCPELMKAGDSLKRYSQEILNAWEQGYTNAYAENINGRIRKLIRDSRGFYCLKNLMDACLVVLSVRHANKQLPRPGELARLAST